MKGWNKLPSKVLVSRSILAVIAIFIQLFLITLFMFYFAKYAAWFFLGYLLFVFLIIVRILNEDENPAFKLSWIITISIFPVLGLTLYLIVQFQIGSRVIGKRLKELRKDNLNFLKQDNSILKDFKIKNKDIYNYIHYMKNVSNFPIYNNTDISYFKLGEEMFEDLLIELKKAKKFIFLEYFIIAKGYMWDSILEILKEKARNGVEIRVLYDGTCSFATLPVYYTYILKEYGIKAMQYAPIKPIISTHYNYRDHRKILIINGLIAYTGGINIADEYINKVDKHGHWKDTAIKLKGNCVNSFTIMFLEMWNVRRKIREDSSQYIVNQNIDNTPGYVLPFSTNPLDKLQVGEFTYIDIINNAKNYVYIMTPYFIVDNEMLTALKNAALKGVDVRIIIPGNADNKTVSALGRSYFKEILKCGVRIYEYDGFIHAKQFLSDDSKGVCGTINLDYRSLYLHFECAVFIYKHNVLKDIKKDFINTITSSKKISTDNLKKYNIINRFYGRVMRLFAPLM